MVSNPYLIVVFNTNHLILQPKKSAHHIDHLYKLFYTHIQHMTITRVIFIHRGVLMKR